MLKQETQDAVRGWLDGLRARASVSTVSDYCGLARKIHEAPPGSGEGRPVAPVGLAAPTVADPQNLRRIGYDGGTSCM